MTEYDRIYHSQHREERNAYTKNWRLENSERRKAYHRKLRYGVSEEQFQALLLLQGGKCAICQEPFDFENKASTPHIDHIHGTQVVRGLLSVDLLKAAFEYLTESL